ncbi:Hypothetical predicted protein [Octopus vulgaris]|uniref:Uncharacterized protein n=1 Tax=Octopus vulgaris TaxID=6645 RepID=A0AA36AMP2_OCTVU|nr:Hypothetical predicted protein [Octopus vulgaris]
MLKTTMGKEKKEKDEKGSGGCGNNGSGGDRCRTATAIAANSLLNYRNIYRSEFDTCLQPAAMLRVV